MLQTMACVFIASMWARVMTSTLPVVVTKMSPIFAASSMVTTWKPSIAACSALIGSISVTSTRAPRPLAACTQPLAHVAVAGDDHDLARDHHVGRALHRVDERFAAAVEIVELALGTRVVDVDRRHLERALLDPLVEAVHAGRRFLGQAVDARDERGILVVDHVGQVAAVIEDHVELRAVGPFERLLDAPVEFLGVHALPGEDRDARGGDGGGGVVLGGEDVARAPAHLPRRAQPASRSARRSGWSCAGSRRSSRP